MAGSAWTAIASTGLLFVLSAFANPLNGDDDLVPAPRQLGELRADAAAYLAALGDAQVFEMRSAKLLDLAWLHWEMIAHPEYQRSRELQSLRRQVGAKLRSGMQDMRRDLIAWLRRQNSSGPAAVGAASGHSYGSGDAGGSQSGGISQAELNSWANYHGYRAHRWWGGSEQYLGYLPGNFAPPGHHADLLIRMIERTISPESWQRNGGNSAIEYFGPAMVLVIRAEQRTHDEVEGLLQRLRELDW